MTRQWHTLIGIVIVGLMLTGCATIVNGERQEFRVISEPSGSAVFVDGFHRGITPTIVEMKRNQSHAVTVERPGYKPYRTTVDRSFTGWIFGNLAFGGIIGLFIDLSTGATYEFSPDSLHVVFPPVAHGQEGSPAPIVRRSEDEEGERTLHRPCGRSC